MQRLFACLSALVIACSAPAIAAPQATVTYVASMVNDSTLPVRRTDLSQGGRMLVFTEDAETFTVAAVTLDGGSQALLVGQSGGNTGLCASVLIDYWDVGINGSVDIVAISYETATDCQYRPHLLVEPTERFQRSFDEIVAIAARFGLEHSRML